METGAATVNILRLGHIEYRVTDLERARFFYVDLLGLTETTRESDCLYLRGLEEGEHHSLVLRKAPSPGLSHYAFRVATENELDRLAESSSASGLATRWIDPETEQGQGRALRVQDPGGFPVEFYSKIAKVERYLQRFDLYRGAQIMRIDHVNCLVPRVQPLSDWYMREWGFACSEYTETDDEPRQLWATWLHRKQNVHDIAFMTGAGPRLHHVAFWVPEIQSIIRACDILAAAGQTEAIERGPGRHGLSNALFLYLRDPDGNRIELYSGDYLIADPDWEPIRWSINDPRRATYWGHVPPKSYYDEASLVESIADGSLIEAGTSSLPDRPVFVTAGPGQD